ncbi:hypothetical protein [Shewanella morhuae]|uniref:Uncharacterized protein n=1 Tax=Shewanella morhuae TaxID=365591 RepID=A0A380ARG9_9GAMM|nr:hypothetical protein [Shewanella morhuae]SUI85900.1 Uncharacterised protein [Shewanella morhuae]
MLSQLLIIILLSLSDYWPNMQPNFQRQVTLLSLIPRAPRKISVNELVERLVNRTQDAGKRSVQRDLKAMYEMGTLGYVLITEVSPMVGRLNLVGAALI